MPTGEFQFRFLNTLLEVRKTSVPCATARLTHERYAQLTSQSISSLQFSQYRTFFELNLRLFVYLRRRFKHCSGRLAVFNRTQFFYLNDCDLRHALTKLSRCLLVDSYQTHAKKRAICPSNKSTSVSCRKFWSAYIKCIGKCSGKELQIC